MKLIKLIGDYFNISRRKAQELINNSQIEVNKEIISSYSIEIDLSKDIVKIDSKLINIKNLEKEKKKYFKFYKPRGIETSQKGLKYYYDKIGIKNLKYAGRLDKESEGLLILSNDGNFINQLTHPSFNKEKLYIVKISGYRKKEQLENLKSEFKYQVIQNNDDFEQYITIQVTLTEGKNRQIRKSCAKHGFTVIRLKRIQMGNINISGLKSGEFQEINHII